MESLSNITFPACLSDREGVYLETNEAFLALFGLDEVSDLLGRTNSSLEFFKNREHFFVPLMNSQKKAFKKWNVSLSKEDYPDPKHPNEKITFISLKLPTATKKGGKALLSILFPSENNDFSNLYDNSVVLKNIVANIPAHIYWKDSEGIYLGCNDRQAKTLGLDSGDDIIGKTDFELPWGKDVAKAFRENDKRIISFEKGEVLEEVVDSEPNPLTLLSHKIPLRDSSSKKPIGILGISTDITEKKKLEEELKASVNELMVSNQLKTSFIQNIEHDFRTPMSSVYDAMQILVSKDVDPEMHYCLKTVQESSTQLLDHCNDILEFSTIKKGFPVLKKAFAPMEILDGVFKMEKVVAYTKQLDLTFDCDPALPPVLMGDPYRFKRILLNLLSNALKFTDDGFVRLRVSVEQHQDRDVALCIEVEDSGCGIPKDEQELIYENFTRLTPSNKERYKGLGLGLSIVQQFVSELSGQIQLTSEVHQGALFQIFLPFELPLSDHILEKRPFGRSTLKDKTASVEKAPIEEEIPVFRCPRVLQPVSVLIVEDNDMIQIAIKIKFIEAGCEVTLASSGEEAVQLATKHHYDVISMDLGLPGISGYEAAATILKGTPNKTTPIVALTAHTDEEIIQQCREAGMKAFFKKPLLPEDLHKLLKNHVPKAYQIISNH